MKLPDLSPTIKALGISRPIKGIGTATICLVALAGCASQPSRYAGGPGGGRYYDPRLGVYASDRVIGDGEPVPHGGGSYLVGRPYMIGGRSYYPSERPEGYTAVGMASWYGDAFHGRRTANGEIFDKNSISAAHPTLPLPSYVRVTNAGNGRSMIVRVNDRGPYHGGRVMDVSQRVADALGFRGQGTARVRVEYIGRASLAGSDDNKLMATLRLDGMPAQLDGESGAPVMMANAEPAAPPAPRAPEPQPQRVARATETDDDSIDESGAAPFRNRLPAPVPPQRPFDFAPDDSSSFGRTPSGRARAFLAAPQASSQARNDLSRLIREGGIGSVPKPPRVTFAPQDPPSPVRRPPVRSAASTGYDGQ